MLGFVALLAAAVSWLLRRAALLAPPPRPLGDARRSRTPGGASRRPSSFLRSGVARLRQRREKRLIEDELPVLLEAIGRSLRSGMSTMGALAESRGQLRGPLGGQVSGIVRRVELGSSLSHALEGWRRNAQSPGIVLASTSLGVGSETGGSRAQAVDGVAATLRERAAQRGEVRALSTQARASAVVMAGTPLVFLSLVSLAGGDTLNFLLTTRVGLACLLVGLFLEAVGAAWMVLLTRAAL